MIVLHIMRFIYLKNKNIILLLWKKKKLLFKDNKKKMMSKKFNINNNWVMKMN